jgi:leucyl-tRNA synthetase
MDERYDPTEVEPRWQERWASKGVFRASSDRAKPKYFVLEMFPYTSGRLHMGHVRNYTMGDVVARYRRMRGFNVLYATGWDAYGLPAENAAIKQGIHPADFTRQSIASMKSAMQRLGFSYDWERERATCDDPYVRAQQVLFLEIYRKGLIHRRKAFVNWCPSCQTVLANEQAQGGVCWRCGSAVTRREVDHWFCHIRAYADELLAGLDRLPAWSESVRNIQRNWIGRSEGAEIDFPVEGGGSIRVFTTRPDTLYGATFVLLAPEHPQSLELARRGGREAEVRRFRDEVFAAERIARKAGDLEKDGVFTGLHAVNPGSGERIPIWIANFVLMEYGTGAIMSVPAHDERDFEFAKKMGLPIRVVIVPEGTGADAPEVRSPAKAFEEPGVMVQSGPHSGLPSEDGKRKVVEMLEGRGIARAVVNFRLQDWSISRQRYWGVPIPIVHCETCGPQPVPERDLPVLLPRDVAFTGEGGSPLARSEAFVRTACPVCGKPARRDTDTMDTFVDSAWYFLRYVTPMGAREPVDRESVRYWLPVDVYVGGVEHAVLHLMYARFFTRVLRDLGHVTFDEPFLQLRNHGMVNDRFGEKQSKSKGNVVEPADVVRMQGADALRVYMMFVTAYDVPINWSDEGVSHSREFLERVWAQVRARAPLFAKLKGAPRPKKDELSPRGVELVRAAHETVAKVARDLDGFSFNTALAATHELSNALKAFEKGADPAAEREALRCLVAALHPFAPHATEEMWEGLGETRWLSESSWPEPDPEVLRRDEKELVLQVNGKPRGHITVPVGIDEAALREAALAHPKVQQWTQGKKVVRVVVVPDRLVNIVVN